MIAGFTITRTFHIGTSRAGRHELEAGPKSAAPPAGRTPRIARLMALAIRFDGLVRRGEVADYAELARLGHVSRARLTQIMNLTLLAPDIQEEILFLPKVERGRDPIAIRMLQPIAAEPMWSRQRKMWKEVTSSL